MTLSDTGFLDLDPLRLEYRMIGPRPDAAPTIVMLHEGLGSVGLWGTFPDKVAAATGVGVFAYSRAGYGRSSPAKLPRPLSFMDGEALDAGVLRDKLKRWHADVDGTFRSWIGPWLDPDFQKWEITEALGYI